MLGSACLSDNPNGMSLPVSEWMLGGPGVGTYLTGPSDDGYGDDRLSYYDYATRITVQEESSATFGGGDFRCDYDRNLNVATGCVFTSLAERLTRMSLSKPEHTLAAPHILVALYQPNATMPPGVHKVIPGLEETGLWLKRTVDGTVLTLPAVTAGELDQLRHGMGVPRPS